MEFRKLLQSDVEFVKDNSISHGVFGKEPSVVAESFALVDGDKVIGIGGIQMINHTSAWGWVDLTFYTYENIRAVYQVTKEWIEKLAEIHKIKRLQAYTEMDFQEGIRFLKHLGFEKESVMKNFVGDKDAYLYVRIF